MELTILDPFGDYDSAGYLRNHFGIKNLSIVGRLEVAAFQDEVHEVIRYLRRIPRIGYGHVLDVHRRLFSSVYPWAGEDRSTNAPHLAIVKAGYNNLFAHPEDVQRATEYALSLATNAIYLTAHPGEVFGYLAHAHPFLEGNGRTILTIFADLCRRAGFHIEWEAIPTSDFLRSLTHELLEPGRHLDGLLKDYTRSGVLYLKETESRLQSNFNRRRP